jgi:hypothetical protein
MIWALATVGGPRAGIGCPVAGADRGGQLAQAQVRDPALHGDGDSGGEQPVPG